MLSAGLSALQAAGGISAHRVTNQPVAAPALTAGSLELPLPPLTSQQAPAQGATEKASGRVQPGLSIASQASASETALCAAGLYGIHRACAASLCVALRHIHGNLGDQYDWQSSKGLAIAWLPSLGGLVSLGLSRQPRNLACLSASTSTVSIRASYTYLFHISSIVPHHWHCQLVLRFHRHRL